VNFRRCILCKRCIRAIKDSEGRSLFAFDKRSHHLEINIDTEIASVITAELAQKAVEICPVGALLLKDKGYETPIGKRTYDNQPIGWEVESKARETVEKGETA
jgi:[NiFe] hydrogenase diaphorase moiety small subunit